MAVLVLTVAAANVGGMFLARSTRRAREIAMRLALGARRARLVRGVVTETLVLFLGAWGVGLTLAAALSSVLEAYRPPIPVRIAVDITPNPRVAVVALGVMALAGTVLGLITGIHSTSPRVVGNLRQAQARTRPRRHRTRTLFVSAQLAVTVVLLVVAGLFTGTVTRAMSADPGLEPEGLVLTGVRTEDAGYSDEEARVVLDELLTRVRARPGIQAAAAFPAPLTGGANSADAILPGGARVGAYYGWFQGEWFATVGTELLAGRTFGPEDEDPDGVRTAVVNEALARSLWPGESPLGRTFELRGDERTVVGVVEDGRYRDMSEQGHPFVFLPWRGGPSPSAAIYLRGADGTTATAVAALREEAATLDPDLVAGSLSTTMTEQIALLLTPQRIAAWIIGVFAAVGLLLAGVGVFGITAFEVGQRRREIGIRMALGAAARSLAGRVARQALQVAGIGLALGVLGSLAVNQIVSRFVFGVSLADPWLLALVPVSLAAVTLLASWIPARRATRVDPVTVLKDV
jgi:predicted permease